MKIGQMQHADHCDLISAFCENGAEIGIVVS
jgi:hypothetical protein